MKSRNFLYYYFLLPAPSIIYGLSVLLAPLLLVLSAALHLWITFGDQPHKKKKKVTRKNPNFQALAHISERKSSGANSHICLFTTNKSLFTFFLDGGSTFTRLIVVCIQSPLHSFHYPHPSGASSCPTPR